MEDLFDFSNPDNILGKATSSPKQKGIGIASTTPSTLEAQRSHGNDTVTNTDLPEKKEDKKKPKSFKIAIIGDPQVGKTTFLTNHLNGSFNASYNATIGASTFHLHFNTNLDSHNYEVFDVAGQNLFAGKRDKYYKDIDGAIIMYDVMNWSSYDNVCDVWLKELTDHNKGPNIIPICIVGNKMENRDIRKVSVEVVAEAISQKFEPRGVGYCEISVKTNQNLAEPFLFLTKRILNIHDSKALYFVSKISESNLIESMLEQKKNKDEQDNKKKTVDSTPNNLDNFFLNTDTNTTKTANNANAAKGGDYLDDFIFSIADKNINNNINNNEQKTNEVSINSLSIGDDDNFLADMMGNQPIKKPKNIKTKSVSATKTQINNTKQQKQKQKQQARNRASSLDKKTAIVAKPPKTKQQSRPKPKAKPQQKQQQQQQDNGVMIDLLLGIQETLNNLQLDVRKLQNDVSYLKQEFQTKSQRK